MAVSRDVRGERRNHRPPLIRPFFMATKITFSDGVLTITGPIPVGKSFRLIGANGEEYEFVVEKVSGCIEVQADLYLE